MLKSLKNDPDNKMLISMKGLIKDIGEFLILIRQYKDYEKIRKFNYNIVDTYDYYNTNDNSIQKYFSTSSSGKYEMQI